MNDIIVIGAGYTGMMAAIGTAVRNRNARVTIVNPVPHFTERLRGHQAATGQDVGVHPIAELVEPAGVRFVQGRAADIAAAGRRVLLEDGRELAYDLLVYAIGSRTVAPDHAFAIDDPGLAEHLRTHPDGVLTVAGGGLTGIEAATEFAEAYPDMTVRLLTRGEPGAMMGPKARAHLDRALRRLGVEVRTGVTVVKVLPDAVELEGGELLPTDGTLWTTGVRTAPLAARAGIETDALGRIVVDTALRSVSHPEIYAIGDAAAIRQSYGTLHGTCQSGIPSAAHAAENLTRRLRGKAPKPFRFAYFHQPVSLGRKDAVIQFTRMDDTPGRWYLKGRAAVAYKEAVTSSPLQFYRARKAIPARMTGFTGGRRNRL